MHNLLTRAQLEEWRHFEDEADDMINDYFECLIECESDNATECRRICKEVFM